MAGAPTTGVDVCNLALARLGIKEAIASIDSTSTKTEDLCALHYPMLRRSLLRGPRIYNFSKKYDQLTVDALTTPAYGYNQAFRLPTDYLRLLTLGDHTIGDNTPKWLYDIVGVHIFTDEEDASETINIQYVYDNNNVATWDAIFIDLIRLELANAMAYAFTLKPSLLRGLMEELKDKRLEAGAVAGQEKPPQRIQRSAWRNRRRGWGNNRDTTQHPI